MISSGSVATLLVIGGHDPSGAGIQADIETCLALGSYAASVLTAVTVQNTVRVAEVMAVPAALLRAQAHALLEDFIPFGACKLGLMAHPEVITAVAEVLSTLPAATPVVVDPVLAAGSGGEFARAETHTLLTTSIFPQATLVTPNFNEARILTGETDLSRIAARIGSLGARYALLTGADEPTEVVRNYLFEGATLLQEYAWPRLPYRYHGSGCTLATSLAVFLAQGFEIRTAVQRAQRYTWHTLAQAHDITGGQRIPNRSVVIERHDLD